MREIVVRELNEIQEIGISEFDIPDFEELATSDLIGCEEE